MKKIIFSVLLSFGFLLTSIPAQAIYDGTSALGSKYVLTIAATKETRVPFCTASMLTDRIVVTAAHCMAKDQGEYPELRFKTSDIYVTQPGIDINVDDISTRVKVLKVVIKPGYKNLWKPEINEQSTQRDDIAFLFLEAPLVAKYNIKIATTEEIEKFVSSGGDVIHFGYGLQKVNVQNGQPYTLKLKTIAGYPTKIDINPQNRFNSTTTIFTKEDGKALCPGDSGGPWYGEINGEFKILAVTVAASGCRSEPPYYGSTLGTLISPYLDFMNQEWIKFLAEEATLKSNMYEEIHRFEIAQKNGTLIVSTGCHANGISAELQINSEGNWSVVATSLGMVSSDKSCPATNPSTPWTVANIPDKSLIRWRYWSPGNWDVLGNPFVYSKQILASASPNPSSSAAQESQPDVSQTHAPSSTNSTISPSAIPKTILSQTPSPKVSPTPSLVNSNKKTIACIKGKTIKKITAFFPRCPSGYQLKK